MEKPACINRYSSRPHQLDRDDDWDYLQSMTGSNRYMYPVPHKGAFLGCPPSPCRRQAESYEPTILGMQHHEGHVRFPFRTREVPLKPKGRQQQIGFSEACVELLEQISDAEKFYRQFLDQYDNDVESIKHYVDEETLRRIWRCRIGVPPHRNSVNSDVSTLEWKRQLRLDKFQRMEQRLESFLEKVVEARIIPSKNEIKVQSAELLREKIGTVAEGIGRMLEGIYQSKESCDQLLIELDELKRLLKPRKHSDKHNGNGYESNGVYEEQEDENNDGDDHRND